MVAGVVINYEFAATHQRIGVVNDVYAEIQEEKRVHLLTDAHPAGSIAGKPDVVTSTVVVPGSHDSYDWRPWSQTFTVLGAKTTNPAAVATFWRAFDPSLPAMYEWTITYSYLSSVEWLSAYPPNQNEQLTYPVSKTGELFRPPENIYYSAAYPDGCGVCRGTLTMRGAVVLVVLRTAGLCSTLTTKRRKSASPKLSMTKCQLGMRRVQRICTWTVAQSRPPPRGRFPSTTLAERI